MTDGDMSPPRGDSVPSAEPDSTTIEVELVSNEGRVTLSGEVDYGVAPRLEDALSRLVSEGVDRLVVDFARLSFFDSACIGALVRAHAQLAEHGGTVKLVNVDRYAHRVLQIAGLLPLFDVQLDE